jgi:uncharacterized protein involved in exopolysaccharide biosynthesis
LGETTRVTTKPVLQVLLEWKRLIYRFVVAAAVLSVAVSLFLPTWYTASSTILPPKESETRRGLIQLTSRLGLDLAGMGLSSDTPSLDVMIGVLKSRRLREQLVDRFELTSVYRAKSREHAIRKLARHVSADNTPESLIRVEVEDRSKDRAAHMTNALVELLDVFNREMSVEQARMTTEFVKGYREENDALLKDATDALQAFQENHGAIELTEQTRVTVEAAAGLEAERTRLEIQRGVLGSYSGPDEIRMVELKSRIDELDAKIDELAGLRPRSTGSGSTRERVFLPLSDIPKLGVELATLTRDVIVKEKVHEYLTTEYEQSRIQEAKDLRTIQVVDRAVPPLKKSRPRRSLIVLLTVALAAIGSIGLAFACDGILEKEGEWARRGVTSIPAEVQVFLRLARRLARWSGAR